MASDGSSAPGESSKYVLYAYAPSLAAAIIFTILFLLTSSLHLYQLIRTRTWFMIPLLVGGFFEWIGYIGRAVSSQQSPDYALAPYIVQSILLLVAPALFAASIYMELGRIIRLTDGEVHSLVRTKWLTTIFVSGDVFSFLMQSSGAGIMARGTNDSMKTGEKIIIGGLLLQCIFFGFFVIVAILFHRKASLVPTERMKNTNFIPWQKHLLALYISSALILVRSIFRVIEYAQGNKGYLLKHEWFLYVFDSCLMFGVLLVFNIVHPSQVNALLKGGKASMKAGLQMHSYDRV
ncbi:MAG: hypothetical protein M1835_003825 [Candelina submexicana]|nr:MAG: hypothetical protein M1835_003825 [Candelina submexicana]